ncbi:MAG: RHS domain-containing protein, partial [Thiobacillus sp.]|nr:RHS domain-containing protein [Thiobacillus sp.]
HIHPDHLGTPRQITDSADRIVWRWDSPDPFGNALPDENPDDGKGKKSLFEFNLRFPGQYYDGETGLHYNYYRDYDPSIGRYTTSDPIGLEGGVNRYAYVGGNPVSFTDPRGLVKWSGTFGGAAYIEGLGTGFFKFDLTSECKCGKIVHIKGYVSSVAAGFGMTATGSGGGTSFSDFNPCPEPDVANGHFIMTAASSVVIGGGGCSKLEIGGLRSSGCGGPAYGLDVSAGVYVGAAVVTSVEIRECCESK